MSTPIGAKGLDTDTVADLVLEHQNRSEVARLLGVQNAALSFHLQKRAVVRKRVYQNGDWAYGYVQLTDDDLKDAFTEYGSPEAAAEALGIHINPMQDFVNRKALEQCTS